MPRHIAILATTYLLAAIALSLLFSVPYIFTAIGMASWVFIGHLITIDDDFPGGFNNPDGADPAPWGELGIKFLILIFLLAIATNPKVRELGG